MNGTLRWYWRAYYDTNRETWPEMGRLRAAWDAFKLAWRVKGR